MLDKKKNYILSGNEPFLKLLDVSDEKGRVRDKRQSKFRQINRFLEIVADVESSIVTDKDLYILDLCCGKSYLSFALYYYFTSRVRELFAFAICAAARAIFPLPHITILPWCWAET